MGWFSRNSSETTQQFGGMTNGMAAQQQPWGAGPAMGSGMNGIAAMQQAQNPMMQQMANDPITATARLLDFNDPVSDFIASANMPLLLELFGSVVTLAIKEFYTSVKFKADGDFYVLDSSSMPSEFTTMSPENLQLLLQQVQNNVNMGIQARAQQQQMFLMAHNPMLSQQQQPGFFGSLIGGMLGNQIQQQGGFGSTMGKGMGTLATGAAIL